MDTGNPVGAGNEYVERARRLAPQIEACADQIERERRLAEPVLDALFAAGMFRLLLPRSLDGGEVDPATFAAVIEEIAKADASTAWCLCQASGCSMSAASFRGQVFKSNIAGVGEAGGFTIPMCDFKT